MRTLLLVASSPTDQSRLRLNSEVKHIKSALQRSTTKQEWKIETNEATTVDDLRRALLEFKPAIVHFSGHGAGEDGLCFEDENGSSHMTKAEPLANLFRHFETTLKCVVLNACYSDVQARTICKEIDQVIGMTSTIGDEPAIKFAVSFYDAIFANSSVVSAFEMACTSIDLNNLNDSDVPTLLTKPVHKDGAIFLDCDSIAQADVFARACLDEAFTEMEIAKIQSAQAEIILTSKAQKLLTAKLHTSTIKGASASVKLELVKEEARLKKIGNALNSVASDPNINGWLTNVQSKVELIIRLIENLNSPYTDAPDSISFDFVLRPRSDASFVFNMPESIVNDLIKKHGFDKHGGERMITSSWGFDVFDLPIGFFMDEILPKLVQFVYFPNHPSAKGAHSDSHLLNTSNWTFGLH